MYKGEVMKKREAKEKRIIKKHLFLSIHNIFKIFVIIVVLTELCGCSKSGSRIGFPVKTPGSSAIPQATTSPVSKLNKITLGSKLLEKDMRINIYTPKGYSEAGSYPVLYVLHGLGEDENSFMPNLGMEKSLDSLIESGKIKPMIVVSSQIDNSFGLNSSVKPGYLGDDPTSNINTGLYENYICNELIPYIDSTYSSIKTKEGRYIGGISMGGFASLHIAFSHPDLFSKVGGHSPALFFKSYWGLDGFKDWIYPDEKVRNERDPLYLAKYKDLSNLKIYLDCGSEDTYKFYEGCEELYSILKSKNYNVEFHLSPGAHSAEYWIANMENYLIFYDSNI